ncbi:MAG: hypothetical protein GEV10_18020 [Streptosporangiales bacterium]|nr:hypothetical protein [Streptosporangiales bacterium]
MTALGDLQASALAVRDQLEAVERAVAELDFDTADLATRFAALGNERVTQRLDQEARLRLASIREQVAAARVALDEYVAACEQAKGAGRATPATAGSSAPVASAAGSAEQPRLRNAQRASVDGRKFTAYSMDPANANNDGKWIAWEELGYDLGQGRQVAADDVQRQLRAQLPDAAVSGVVETRHGPRHSTRTTVVGPNGRTGTLVSVWQYDHDSDEPRMITHWLEVHTEKGER